MTTPTTQLEPELPEPIRRKLHEMEQAAEMRGYVGFIRHVNELRVLLSALAAAPMPTQEG